MTQYTTQQIPPQDTTEEWRDIPSYEGRFQVSNFGHVRSNRPRTRLPETWKLLKLGVGTNGYVKVTLCMHNKPSTKNVHRLVMLAFVGPCPDGIQVNHKNGDKSDNRLDNLEYVTPTQNARHAYDELGKRWGYLECPGELNPQAVLTENDIKTIRFLAANGVSNRVLAERFGMAYGTIWDIVTHKTWRHIA